MRIAVTVTEADRGADVFVLDRLINAATVEARIGDELAKDLSISTSVTCGSRVAVVPIGGELLCSAVDERGIARPLIVTIGAAQELSIQLG